MRVRVKATKRGFMDVYKKTYDTSEGHGNPAEWRNNFFERLGIDKAKEVLGADDPLTLLGITCLMPSWEQICKAYRKLILQCHPDRNLTDVEECLQKAKKVNAAMEILENRYGNR
jgi:hypothetical protein